MGTMIFTGGRPETRCGAGSTLSYTVMIRRWLPIVFHELRLTAVLDAPCGDFNWMAQTDLRGLTYVGIDYDERNCAKARSKDSLPGFQPIKKIIYCDDILKAVPCCAELMLCRDFWQHLPTDRVREALQCYLRSGIKWLMGTSHKADVNRDIPRDGMFRPLNMMIKPFCFPPPRKMISDGDSRILALWSRDDVDQSLSDLPVYSAGLV